MKNDGTLRQSWTNGWWSSKSFSLFIASRSWGWLVMPTQSHSQVRKPTLSQWIYLFAPVSNTKNGSGNMVSMSISSMLAAKNHALNVNWQTLVSMYHLMLYNLAVDAVLAGMTITDAVNKSHLISLHTNTRLVVAGKWQLGLQGFKGKTVGAKNVAVILLWLESHLSCWWMLASRSKLTMKLLIMYDSLNLGSIDFAGWWSCLSIRAKRARKTN